MQNFIIEFNKLQESGQNSLFDSTPHIQVSGLKLMEAPALEKRQKLTWEKEYLGLYVSEHPMTEFEKPLQSFVVGCSVLKNCVAGSEVRVAGVISTVKKIFTKKNEAMVFAKIEDSSGDVEILVFPRVLEQNPHLWEPDNIIICSGKISDKDDESKVLCDRAMILNPTNISEVLKTFLLTHADPSSRRFYEKKPKPPKKIILNINSPMDFELSKKIKLTVLQNQGMDSLQISINNTSGSGEIINTSYKVNGNKELMEQLEQLIGEGSVVLG
jgi:DNA polymerase-3 subunit alpha